MRWKISSLRSNFNNDLKFYILVYIVYDCIYFNVWQTRTRARTHIFVNENCLYRIVCNGVEVIKRFLPPLRSFSSLLFIHLIKEETRRKGKFFSHPVRTNEEAGFHNEYLKPSSFPLLCRSAVLNFAQKTGRIFSCTIYIDYWNIHASESHFLLKER